MSQHPILIVDDEPEILGSLNALLQPEFDVRTAGSGKEAIEILSGCSVHVVMTDQRMPDMTGVELLAHVREGCPDAVRLVFTGYADIKAVIEAINQGRVSRYVTKPWDPDELTVVLRQACQEYDQMAERARVMQDVRAVLAACVDALDGSPGVRELADRGRELLVRLDTTS